MNDYGQHEGYDTDYGYRGGIGLGSRWAHRGGNPGWSSGGRRVGGWARDYPPHERQNFGYSARPAHRPMPGSYDAPYRGRGFLFEGGDEW